MKLSDLIFLRKVDAASRRLERGDKPPRVLRLLLRAFGSPVAFSVMLVLTPFITLSVRGQSFYSRAYGGSEPDTHATLAINASGACLLTREMTQSRRSLETQITVWERYSKMSDGGLPDADEEPAISAPPPAKTDQKPLTDEQLPAKIREMYQQQSEAGDGEGVKIDKIELTTNSVRVIMTRSFSSLKALLSENIYTWAPNILMLQSARFEMDTNRNLRITFGSALAAARFGKSSLRQWKSMKAKFEWDLVLPGKILSSSLPVTKDNTTSLIIDCDKPETIEAAANLIGSSVVITAEPAGLNLSESLDSKTPFRSRSRGSNLDPDLPITDAFSGFVAEPVSVSLTTVHYFPEGERFFKDRLESTMFGMYSTGAVVSAKLFPPKGREIKSISGLRVKAAKDDQGRSIPELAEDSDSETVVSSVESFSPDGGSEKPGAARVDFRLELPAPDAKTIEELQAEAVALTIGGWKEMTLTNVQADAKKEIDLGELVPGAKLVIKKTSKQAQQKSVDATLEGPPIIAQLELKIKLHNTRAGGASSRMYDRHNAASGNKRTRSVTVQGFEFDPNGGTQSGPIDLIVRSPPALKRERVQVKL